MDAVRAPVTEKTAASINAPGTKGRRRPIGTDGALVRRMDDRLAASILSLARQILKTGGHRLGVPVDGLLPELLSNKKLALQ